MDFRFWNRRVSIVIKPQRLLRFDYKGLWASSPLSIGSSLRLIDPKRISDKEFVVDTDRGVVIMDGDTLVPCTTLMQGLYCRRKAILADRFRGGGSTNKAMFIGNIVHALFQYAVRLDERSGAKLSAEWLLNEWREKFRPNQLQQMIALNMSSSQLENELSVYLDSTVDWIGRYMPKPLGRSESLECGSRIEQIADIEENIWDHLIGIKGKVDASLKVKTRSSQTLIEP
ncbi:unnamed protein product, partial [Anisakis simplex]|uniref:DNA replication ATP-dependent helicase/nuclease DNA2 (inferred by orthology to a human protein) n=1 Tax=Anisakis simplex TaxID=6269 RepID=A0A0M3J8Q4_ANISI